MNLVIYFVEGSHEVDIDHFLPVVADTKKEVTDELLKLSKDAFLKKDKTFVFRGCKLNTVVFYNKIFGFLDPEILTFEEWIEESKNYFK